MQTEYNLDFLLENTGCYESEQIENLFPKDREVVSYKDILQSNISLEDKYWFFCKRVFTDSQNQHIAIKIAEVVLPIFEEEYPSDNRPRKAIEAARLYLTGHISLEKLLTARKAAIYAAAAAYTADDDAYAASDACWAAGAAAADACWAAGAARAAAAAAWAADDADDAADKTTNPKYKKELEELLINFIETNK
jgi:hypothetical protein